jgi:hypothetical protein
VDPHTTPTSPIDINNSSTEAAAATCQGRVDTLPGSLSGALPCCRTLVVVGVLEHLQSKIFIEVSLGLLCLSALAVDKPSIDHTHAKDRMIDLITPIVCLECSLQLQRGLAMSVALVDPATRLSIIDLCSQWLRHFQVHLLWQLPFLQMSPFSATVGRTFL